MSGAAITLNRQRSDRIRCRGQGMRCPQHHGFLKREAGTAPRLRRRRSERTRTSTASCIATQWWRRLTLIATARPTSQQPSLRRCADERHSRRCRTPDDTAHRTSYNWMNRRCVWMVDRLIDTRYCAGRSLETRGCRRYTERKLPPGGGRHGRMAAMPAGYGHVQ